MFFSVEKEKYKSSFETRCHSRSFTTVAPSVIRCPSNSKVSSVVASSFEVPSVVAFTSEVSAAVASRALVVPERKAELIFGMRSLKEYECSLEIHCDNL